MHTEINGLLLICMCMHTFNNTLPHYKKEIKRVWWFLKKLSIALPHGPPISIKYVLKRIESRDLNTYLYTNVHSSIVHNN